MTATIKTSILYDVTKVLVKNRKAYFDYEILEKFEAGIVLLGHEVKSLKNGGGNMSGSFVNIRNGEIFIEKFKISLYAKTTIEFYNPERPRKLLLRKAEISKITGELNTKGVTLIPLECRLDKNLIKIEFALARGKKKYDKRESLKSKDQERRIKAALKQR